ncbi:creatinine amidohydrolase [Amycolatopsis arida]|uniref:Creatinine amidohydrolase n=1 Tax=Amycolatopsis arida TaxID=587909 RepID=A0A1I5P4W6_9PSEU|nr:creatininase family protein [Amycolatopsis arida]TDX98358.1 creatinine amidohydrolase [Amycolatopsis arida]SFP29027.1 creatinine amidohydrolase [Amycolatopsis arida]
MTYFADLTSPQVAALRDDDRVPVLLLPIGAVEPHGPHAPLGTDALISTALCERVAARCTGDPGLRVLILPALPYGVTRYAAEFPGTVGVGEEALHALVTEVCLGLVDQGLPRIVLVNNHFEPEHVATLRRAVRTVESARGVRLGHLDLVRRHYAARLTAEFRAGECHAGRYETSLVLAERPELVDRATMRTLPRVAVNLPAAMADGRRSFRALGMNRAYCGAPAEATGEEGSATFDTLAELLVDTIRALVEGSP